MIKHVINILYYIISKSNDEISYVNTLSLTPAPHPHPKKKRGGVSESIKK